MLSIQLHNTGKKFGREWIFRQLSLDLVPASRLAILGGNGSGKSTLLQVIAGYITPNEGEIIYRNHAGIVDKAEINSKISFASPYLQLVEEFTGTELVAHISKFKPFINKMTPTEVLEAAGLSHAAGKFIKQYSSGMKQRLKLALAIFADTPLLLLDEPASNLDKEAIGWYQKVILSNDPGRTVIVCSNAIESEYNFCDKVLKIEDYKN